MFKSFRKANENAQVRVDRNGEFLDIFKPTTKINKLEVDEVNELFRVRGLNSIYLHYDELVDYKLIVDDEEVTSGGLGVGRALVGGALAGGVGALLGGLTKKRKTKKVITSLDLEIRYTFNDQDGVYIVPLITGKTKVNSSKHRQAVKDSENALRLLDKMVDTKEEPILSAADELMKYKELLDMDAITQDEFDEVKKKLLK